MIIDHCQVCVRIYHKMSYWFIDYWLDEWWRISKKIPKRGCNRSLKGAWSPEAVHTGHALFSIRSQHSIIRREDPIGFTVLASERVTFLKCVSHPTCTALSLGGNKLNCVRLHRTSPKSVLGQISPDPKGMSETEAPLSLRRGSLKEVTNRPSRDRRIFALVSALWPAVHILLYAAHRHNSTHSGARLMGIQNKPETWFLKARQPLWWGLVFNSPQLIPSPHIFGLTPLPCRWIRYLPLSPWLSACARDLRTWDPKVTPISPIQSDFIYPIYTSSGILLSRGFYLAFIAATIY